MKCRYCGRQIPDNMLHCKYCGKEVRIVPDYNPLDDMLAEQVKVSINGSDEDYLAYNPEQEDRRTRNMSATRHTMHTGRTQATRSMNGQPAEAAQRRKQAERKKALKRKKRQRLLILMFICLFAIVGVSVVVYQNSYTGIVKKASKEFSSEHYKEATQLYKKAISKDESRIEAYEGLAQVYIKQNDLVKAEDLFLNAIAANPENYELYEACIEFYLAAGQEMEIPKLLENADEKVKDKLSEYIVTPPTFSLDAEKVYDDVQQLSLESSGSSIYYTLDGKAPTADSTAYTEPIILEEGETVVKAITVNKKGVPSLAAAKTYVIEFPLVDAPAVSPSTGQYEEATDIEIKVPEGYTAYYTMDGKDPTTASKKYTGPIKMPEGEILFKAVLVNESGRASGITTRNYVLEISEE